MALQTRTTLKGKFETGDIPVEQDFIDLIDSCPNITDDDIAPFNTNIRVYLSANQSITQSTNVKVQFNLESYDDNNEWDNVTNYRFTATEAGTYYIGFSGLLLSVADGIAYNFKLYKNGSQVSQLGFNASNPLASLGGAGLDFADTQKLIIGDYIEFFMLHTDSVARDLQASAPSNSAYGIIRRVK